jgi:hypothetical protein
LLWRHRLTKRLRAKILLVSTLEVYAVLAFIRKQIGGQINPVHAPAMMKARLRGDAVFRLLAHHKLRIKVLGH